MPAFDLRIRWAESSEFGPKSDDIGHRIIKSDFIRSDFAKSDCIRPILMQSDRWIEKGGFRSETKSSILTQSKKCLFDPNFFDRAIRSTHPVEKIDFFKVMCGSHCSIERIFEAHRISHHPTRHTITPYNSSDAGLTATMLLPLLLLLLLTTTRRGTSCSPPASSAYRHPMAAVRVIDDIF